MTDTDVTMDHGALLGEADVLAALPPVRTHGVVMDALLADDSDAAEATSGKIILACIAVGVVLCLYLGLMQAGVLPSLPWTWS